MSVTTGDVVTQIFTTANPATGAAADADSLPTGVLWLNGVANGATVTIADATGTGKYTFSVTIPTVTQAQRVQVVVDATIGGVACSGEVWNDQAIPSANVTYSAGVAVSGRLAEVTDLPSEAPAASVIADAVLDEVVEGTLTLRKILRITLAKLANKASGGSTTTIRYRSLADDKDRIIETVDSDGNRSAVTLDGD